MSLLKIEVNRDSLKNTISYINKKLHRSEETLKANFDIPCLVSSKLSHIKKKKDNIEFYYDMKVYKIDYEGRKRNCIFE